MTHLVSIQNLGPEKFQKRLRKGLTIFSDLKKTDLGENGVKKTEAKKLLDSVFFRIFPPHVWD